MAKWVYAMANEMRRAPWMVESRLTGKVGDEQVDNELSNLQGCQVLLPLRNAARHKSTASESEWRALRLTQILAPPAVA